MAAGLTEQLAALQQVLPDQPPGLVEVSVQVPSGSLQVTPPEQQLVPHVTVQDSVAVQEIAPEQELLPQCTVHVDPPQTTPPEHELDPHSMSQLAAFEQSTCPLHPLSPHCTTQATPGGQVTPEEHLPAQSMTQLPLASHVPPGHDWAEHAVAPGEPPVLLEEPHAARRARTDKRESTRCMSIGVRRVPGERQHARAARLRVSRQRLGMSEAHRGSW